MEAVFLDTVGLIALWDQRDQWHADAKACLATLNLQTTRLVTTSFVLLECANHAARRVYRAEVVKMRDDLAVSGDLIEPLASEVDLAWVGYANRVGSGAGVVDLVSFAVMRRLGISEAFTNDNHFTAAGFKVLF